MGGFLADQYVLYDLKNNSKKEFLSEFDWYKSRFINEPFDFAFNNKVICSELLKQYAYTPENYFIKNKGKIYDFNNEIKEAADVITILIKKEKLIIKPFASGKGDGVHLMSFDEDFFFIDDRNCSEEELRQFLRRNNNYIVTEYIQQHIYAERFFEKTTNTIRLITMRDFNTSKTKIFFALQRIGTAETIPVDNGSKGGLVAKIDIETGELSAAKSIHNLNTYPVHPNTNAKIEGSIVPMWDDIKQVALNLANKFPYMDFIAWDFLLTDRGPCIIEANNSSGVNIIQIWGGQRNGELGEFYKHHKVIKSTPHDLKVEC